MHALAQSWLGMGVRTRISLIFFVGLALLTGATLAVSLMVSGYIGQDEARLALLRQLDAKLTQAPVRTISVAADVESPLNILLHGGTISHGGNLLTLQPADDASFVQLLQAAQSQSAQLDTRANQDASAESQQPILRSLQETFAESIRLVELDQANNTGMIRGLYAALFLSSLLFLLIGLWLTQQQIVAPVEELERVANRIAAEDLETPVVLEGQGEFLRLAQSFETMRLNLRESHERLTRWTHDLEEHVTRRTQQLAALSEVISAASRSLELDAVLGTALDHSMQVLGVDVGALWLKEEAGSDLRLAASRGMSDTMRCELQILELDTGVTARAVMTGQTIVVEDIAQSPYTLKSIALREGIRSLVAVPIKVRECVLGAFDVMMFHPRAFMPEEVALLASIGQQIGIAVESVRLMREVREQTQQLAALQERERIGAELHDGLLQILSYQYLKLDQLEAFATKQGMDALAGELSFQREVLERAARELRKFIAALREMPPPPAPLQNALAEMIDAFTKENTMQVSLQTEAGPLLLRADHTIHLERIAREALVNAAQHGGARHAVVTLSVQEGQGALCIADDGVGFQVGQPPNDGREHFGLHIMQARASNIGGALRIDSQPGQGARVWVTFPIPLIPEKNHEYTQNLGRR